MTKKQSTLFPEGEVTVLAELDLKEAERLANQHFASLRLEFGFYFSQLPLIIDTLVTIQVENALSSLIQYK